jgi:hypothetical protein
LLVIRGFTRHFCPAVSAYSWNFIAGHQSETSDSFRQQLAAKDERFRFALEACVDWRYAKDRRAAIARLWAGIESLFGISSELVYRISLLASTVVAPRGLERLAAFQRLKKLYGIRSKAVHGEPLADSVLSLGLSESFELLRTLLLDAVERGQLRDDADYLSELLC